MSAKAVFPPGSEAAAETLALSPGVASNGHLFLSGMTGSDAAGNMPEDPETQFRNAFNKIKAVLDMAGVPLSEIVEMTTYHIGLRAHFDLFNAVRRDYVTKPFPAWTAVEVAGLRRENAVVEIRIIAAMSESSPQC